MHYRYMHSCLIVLSSNYKTLKSELLSLDWTELEQWRTDSDRADISLASIRPSLSLRSGQRPNMHASPASGSKFKEQQLA